MRSQDHGFRDDRTSHISFRMQDLNDDGKIVYG